MLDPGETFGLWTVVSGGFTGGRHRKTLCICSCGTERMVSVEHLRSGRSKCCGCERRRTLKEKTGKTPKEETPGYNSWRGMRERCSKPKHISYHWYGAKGIRVCRRWQESFVAFIEDMGAPPAGKQWIERVDGSRDYEPGNCVWSTPAQQLRNHGRNRHLTALGRTMVLQDWASELRVHRSSIEVRLKRGLSPEEVIRELAAEEV